MTSNRADILADYPSADPSFVDVLLREKTILERLTAEKKEEIRTSCGPGLSDAQLGAFLEAALTTGLNPLRGEITARLDGSVDGDDGTGRMVIIVKRDGLLRMAERLDDYRGFDAGVVYEKDTFRRVEPKPGSLSLRERAGVVHIQDQAPDHKDAIVGAWCVAEREGRPPRFTWADFEDYAPDEGTSGWWDHRGAVMIEKVPLSYALRTLCAISGVYLEEEVARGIGRGIEADGTEVDFGVENEAVAIDAAIMALPGKDAEWRSALASGIRQINELEPGRWPLSAVQMKIVGQDEEGLQAQMVDVKADLERARAGKSGSTTTRPPEDDLDDAPGNPSGKGE